MSDTDGRDIFQEDNAARTYKILISLLVLLLLSVTALHFKANTLQKDLTQTVSAAQAQSMLTQRIALLISQFQSNDASALEDLRNTVSAAMSNEEMLESDFQSALPAMLGDGTSTRDSLEKLGEYIGKSATYASQAQEPRTKASGQAIIAQARDVAALWNTLTTEYITRAQSRLDILIYACLGMYFLMLDILVFLYLKIFRPALANLKEQRKQLNRFAAIDPLTEVYNRPMLFKVARMLIGAFKRQQQPMCALLIDIDRLRKVNEKYGRAAGDLLVKKIAAVISKTLRSSDAVGRLGGGEFGVFLPSLDESRAIVVAEKIRLAVEEMGFAVKENAIPATVSIGLAETRNYHNTPDELLRSASIALRHAKNQGPNQVVIFSVIEGATE